jgi:hypothetical protein
MQCAELYGHYPPQELGKKIVQLARSYNDALVGVERNNHGYGVLAVVENESYSHIYREGQQAGWLTSAVTRPAMIENLAAVLTAEPRLFHSPLFLGECRTFVRHPDGSTRAATGAHDDAVMAMAVAFAVRRAATQETADREMELATL